MKEIRSLILIFSGAFLLIFGGLYWQNNFYVSPVVEEVAQQTDQPLVVNIFHLGDELIEIPLSDVSVEIRVNTKH